MLRSQQRRNVRKFWQIAACAVLCLTVLGACATMPTQSPGEFYMRHRATLKLAVQIVVVEFLHRHKDMAEQVAAIAITLQAELQGQSGDIAIFETVFKQKVLDLQLSPAGQLLFTSLGESLVEMIRNYIVERSGIPHETFMRLGDIAGWIAESARKQARP